MISSLLVIILFVVILNLVILYRESGVSSSIFWYIFIFSIFFIFRSVFLIYDFDVVFPEAIYYGNLTSETYLEGLLYAFTYFILLLVLSFFFGGKVAPRNFVNIDGAVFVLRRASILVFFISIAYFMYSLSIAGSFERIIYVARIDKDVGFGFLKSAISYGILLSAIYLGSRMSFLSISIYLIFIVMNVGVGDRSGIIYSVFLVFLMHAVGQDMKVKWGRLPWAFIGVFLVVLVAVVSKEARTEAIGGEQDGGIIRAISSGLNLNVVDAYYLAVSYVGDIIPYRLGEDFWLGIVGLVPRFIWADKPEVINTGVWFAQIFSDLKMGTPITSLGEWVLNFGFFGVVIGACVTFLACRLFDTYFYFGRFTNLLRVVFVLLVVQTGFSNTILRDFVQFALFVIFPLYVGAKVFVNENSFNK